MRASVVRLVLGAVLLATPGASRAEPISPPNATVPSCISLVGTNGTRASGVGTFEVIYRDLANNPVPGVHIDIDLSNAPDLRLCAQQIAPGVVVDCVSDHASGITDANGRAVFTLLGSGIGSPTGSGFHNGRIYANGVLLGSPTVSAYDLDGMSGVGANDFSLWLADFSIGGYYGRGDYDCSGYVGANDLSLWLTEFGAGASSISCAASCP